MNISWTQANGEVVDSYNIYVSATFFDGNNLPNVYAEVPGNVFTADIGTNEEVYVKIGAVKGGIEKLSLTFWVKAGSPSLPNYAIENFALGGGLGSSYACCFSADNNEFYITEGNNLFIYQTADWSYVENPSFFSGYCYYLKITKDDNYLIGYVSDHGVLLYRKADLSVVEGFVLDCKIYNNGPSPYTPVIDIDPSGENIFYVPATNTKQLKVYNINTLSENVNHPLYNMEMSNEIEDIKLSNDGSLLGIMVNNLSNGFFCVNTTDQTFVDVGKVIRGSESKGIAFTPNNEHVFLGNMPLFAELTKLNLNTKEQTTIKTSREIKKIEMFPDGLFLALGTDSNTGREDLVYSTSDLSMRVLPTTPTDEVNDIGISSDGKYLICACDSYTDYEAYRIKTT